jgi:hypothetical protein
VTRQQLIHKQEYWVRQKEPTTLANMVRTDDRAVYLERLSKELEHIRADQERYQSQIMMEEQSTRIKAFGQHLQASLTRETENLKMLEDLSEIQRFRSFVAPPRKTQNNEQDHVDKKTRQIKQRRARRQKQKSLTRMIKQEQADTTVLQFRTQTWTTKAFARAELPPDELTKVFGR